MKFLRALISSILAMLVLFSSMGFFVDHMVCGMSGEHKLAINTSIEHCADSCERPHENAVKKSCCEYASFYFQEDAPATANEIQVPVFASAFAFLPLPYVFVAHNCADGHCTHLYDEAKILPSVERHILLQTFLI